VACDARRGRTLGRDQRDVVPAVLMEAAHRLEQRGEAVAVSRVEERGKSVERVGRDCLEFVGVHDVSSIRTGCPGFLHSQRNPTARLEDTPREGAPNAETSSPGVPAGCCWRE